MRRPSITIPDDTSFIPRDHTFIKTTFGKREFTTTAKLNDWVMFFTSRGMQGLPEQREEICCDLR